MAKRKSTQPTPEQKYEAILKRRELLLKLMYGIVGIIIILFGYSYGYPIVAAGQLWWGIFIGMVYSLGALLLVVAAFYLNRKMKGL